MNAETSCYNLRVFAGDGWKEQHLLRNLLNSLVSHRTGAFAFLALAAGLEAFGDSLFQSGIYRSAGSAAERFSFLGRLSWRFMDSR